MDVVGKGPSGPRHAGYTQVDGSSGGEGVEIAYDELQPKPRRRALPGNQGLHRLTWHPASQLTVEAQAELFRVLPIISSIAFGLDTAPYWRERHAEGFFDKTTEFTLIVNEAKRLVGWATFRAFTVTGHRCLYLDSTGVLPKFQSRGLISRIQGYAIIREFLKIPVRPLYLTLRTESPVIYRMLVGVGSTNIFPQPAVSVPQTVREVGSETARILGQYEKLIEAELRIEHAYVELYGRDDESLPASGDPELDRFFRQQLGLDDAFIVVARLTLPHALLWVARRPLSRGGSSPQRRGS